MPAPTDAEYFDLGNFTLQSGHTLRGATLAFKTYGTLNADRSNVIVYPTWYSGWHKDNEWLIGPGRVLDPAEKFIIVPNMLGNGLSSSPSNTPAPYDGPRFPDVTFYDQVEAQYRLVTEEFGITSIALVTGWSMGAGQTYQWAVSHPEMVQRAAPFCGSSITAPHNKVFLESLVAALSADATFAGGDYEPDRLPVKGLRAFARVYSGWGYSQAFYWQETWRELGYTSFDDFLYGFWEGFFRDGRDPNNLITMIGTWHSGNVGNTPGFDGDVQKALASIKCPLLAMPAEKDLYFPPEDEQWASEFIPHGEVRVIPGIWGHFAGGGANDADTDFIDAGLRELMAKPGYSPAE
ncbi:MAG: alpha/beta fold hydrolase [Mycobacterium sp.]|nr:alpha/beta fold hydrolase [Mycobacterium sp.]